MATPKLQTTRSERASEIQDSNVLPELPDGRFVIIGKRDFYFTNFLGCSCGDNRYKGNTCKHMLKLREISH